ncbi:MAG: META domain-containing protein [Alphaproteobacteria bacterium]|jgi:heat shock protein HslJ|nr:META domain-containing protein [Alphaproteobacteria bacterium]
MKKSFLSLLLLVLISSCVSVNKSFEDYYWRLVAIEGEGVPTFEKTLLSNKNAYISFQGNNRITGFTSCNTINGKFSREKNVTHFLGVVTTKNKCSADKMKIEKNFILFLKQSEYMIVNRDNLTIYNENMDIILVFKKEVLPVK